MCDWLLIDLPEVAVEALGTFDGDEVHREDAAIFHDHFFAEGDRGRGQGLGNSLARRLGIPHLGHAHLHEFIGLAVHQQVGGHGNLEEAAEGLVDERHLPVLGLHQNARLHVLDQGPQAAVDGGQGGLVVFAFGDVREGSGHADRSFSKAALSRQTKYKSSRLLYWGCCCTVVR